MIETDTSQMTIWRMRTSCWLPKTADSHSEYVILTTFQRKQRSHERASILHLHVHCQSYLTGVLISPYPDLLPDVFCLIEYFV
jgi:hypothetical protein